MYIVSAHRIDHIFIERVCTSCSVYLRRRIINILMPFWPNMSQKSINNYSIRHSLSTAIQPHKRWFAFQAFLFDRNICPLFFDKSLQFIEALWFSLTDLFFESSPKINIIRSIHKSTRRDKFCPTQWEIVLKYVVNYPEVIAWLRVSSSTWFLMEKIPVIPIS